MRFYRAIHLLLQMECACIMLRIVVAYAQDFCGSHHNPVNFPLPIQKPEFQKLPHTTTGKRLLRIPSALHTINL